MKFATKLIVATITIAGTIVGSIWTGFETIDGRMDTKVKEGKAEVLNIIHTFREERNALLKAQDDKVTVQITALNSQMGEIKKDVRAILGIARSQKVVFEKTPTPQYTNLEPENKETKL